MDLAGADSSRYLVFLGDDYVGLEPDRTTHRLVGSTPDFAIDLRLTPERPPVIHGRDGVSQKSAGLGNASHYYSLTRLATRGRLTLGGDTLTVDGLSWMDPRVRERPARQLAHGMGLVLGAALRRVRPDALSHAHGGRKARHLFFRHDGRARWPRAPARRRRLRHPRRGAMGEPAHQRPLSRRLVGGERARRLAAAPVHAHGRGPGAGGGNHGRASRTGREACASPAGMRGRS
jgi:hypothetical protein